MLDLTGVTHTYRFKLAGFPPVTGSRGAAKTVAGETAVVKVNDRAEAFSVVVSGRENGTGPIAHAIFYRMDLTAPGVDPVAVELAQAAEREFGMIGQGASIDQRS